MCALKRCNLPCQWDAKDSKWRTYCSPDHASKARGGDVACPAMIISVVDASMSEDEMLAGTNTYVTPLVLRVSAQKEDLEAKAASLARSLVSDDELRDINMTDPDDVEELGKVMLIAAFEQVSGPAVSEKDRTNIEDAWQPGLNSASAVAEIYTGKYAQEIANLYNALAEELLARCTRMQQEIASQNEINQILQHEATRLGEDLATKMEIARITAKEEIESLARGVVYEIVDVVFHRLRRLSKSHMK